QPIAGALQGIGTIAVMLAQRRAKETTLRRLKRHKGIAFRHIAQGMAAALADCIFEIDGVAAVVAGKKLHEDVPRLSAKCAASTVRSRCNRHGGHALTAHLRRNAKMAINTSLDTDKVRDRA